MPVRTLPPLDADTRDRLWREAVAVLHTNDLGDATKPAPRLYPHQWSWDSAFIAIGRAQLDPDRALRELETLFAAQWADGRVPQIVYRAGSTGYFPGPDRWAASALSPLAPRAPATSGIVQPPAHALAAWLIWRSRPDDAALRERFRALYTRLFAWHRYLATARDPDGEGLTTIYHPWESGTDNSPRWDEPLARFELGPVPPYQRRDLEHVDDAAQRPSQAEYDRYLWLIESLKACRYDDAELHRHHPFLIKDVFFSALFALASWALGQLGEALGAAEGELHALSAWSERAAHAVERCWDEQLRLCLDLDRRSGAPIRVQTSAGLAALLLPTGTAALQAALEGELFGPRFAGAAELAYPVIPSTVPGSPGFSAPTYWRGPSWPVIDWLFSWSLAHHGSTAQAAALRDANLAMLAQPGADFAEYFDIRTGAPLGSRRQSWTAAVTLAWLAGVPHLPA